MNLFLQIHAPNQFLNKIANIGVGKNNCISLLELIRLYQELIGNKIAIKNNPKTRPADVRIYYTDNSAILDVSGWSPSRSVGSCLKDTLEWIRSYEED